MIKRVIAWVVFLAVCVGGYEAYKAFKNPWGSGASPVLSRLPVSSNGCGDDCK